MLSTRSTFPWLQGSSCGATDGEPGKVGDPVILSADFVFFKKFIAMVGVGVSSVGMTPFELMPSRE